MGAPSFAYSVKLPGMQGSFMQALAVDSYAILMTLKFCLVSVQAAIYAVLVRYLPNPALHLAGRLLKAAQIPAVLTQSSCCHHFRTRWRPDGDAAGCSLGHLWHWGDWFPTICGCLSRHHRACGASGRTCDSGLSEGLSFSPEATRGQPQGADCFGLWEQTPLGRRSWWPRSENTGLPEWGNCSRVAT